MTENHKDVQIIEDSIHPNYKKGFEHGYWLQRGGSKELDGIMQRNAKAEHYHAGLKAGKNEATREAFRERMAKIDKDRENDKGMEQD